MKKLLFLLISSTLLAQQVDPKRDASFAVYHTDSLTSSAEVLTIQNIVKTSKSVVFKSAYLYCSAACTINIEVNGSAATSTSLTSSIYNINPNNASAATSVTNAYTSSNVGNGNILNQIQLGAGGSVTVSLSDFILPAGAATNLSFRTNSITGTTTIGVSWYEQ